VYAFQTIIRNLTLRFRDCILPTHIYASIHGDQLKLRMELPLLDELSHYIHRFTAETIRDPSSAVKMLSHHPLNFKPSVPRVLPRGKRQPELPTQLHSMARSKNAWNYTSTPHYISTDRMEISVDIPDTYSEGVRLKSRLYTGYPYCCFSYCPQSLQGNVGIVPLLGRDGFLPNPFRFINYPTTGCYMV
jgi:hypothetical protein